MVVNPSSSSLMDPGPDLLFHLRLEEYVVSVMLVSALFITFLLNVIWHSHLKAVSQWFPESCFVILCGITFGGIFQAMGTFEVLERYLTSTTFFELLLPPIILSSAYQLYCKEFLYNVVGVLFFAVLGTTLNVFAIGFSLYGAYGLHNDWSVMKCLLLSTIICAVDPVAVLAVFKEVGVQKSLYFLILGESLLNDGVTLVMFETLEKITFVNVEPVTFAYAVLSFFTVAFGGTLVGIFVGCLCSLCVKLTSRRSEKFEPLLVILGAIIGFRLAEMFSWSGILALIGIGLTQKRYTFPNLNQKSKEMVIKITEFLAELAETSIFLILGFKLWADPIRWDYKLILLSNAFCFLYRFVFTFILGTVLNFFQMQRLSMKHLFIMSYGGLRGAVAFAMVAALHNEDKNLFIGTTLAVIFATVFIQGSTIKFFVNLLHFKEPLQKRKVIHEFSEQVNVHVLAGMQTILGGNSSTMHYWIEKIERFENKYIYPVLCKKTSGEVKLDALRAAAGHHQESPSQKSSEETFSESED